VSNGRTTDIMEKVWKKGLSPNTDTTKQLPAKTAKLHKTPHPG